MKELLDNRTGKESKLKTYFSYEKRCNLLVFNFECHNSSLNSYSDKDNDELYKGDVCEVFLDIGGESYYEFEVAPNGAKFVAKIINGTPHFIDDSFFMSVAKIKGNSYTVKMIIDVSKIGSITELNFNAFRIETKRVKRDFILQAYSPTLSNTFHVRECFINIPLP